MTNNSLRTESLLRGNNTFTSDRLAAILSNEKFAYDHRSDPTAREYSGIIYAPVELGREIDSGYFVFEQIHGGLRCSENRTAQLRATEFCQQLYGRLPSINCCC